MGNAKMTNEFTVIKTRLDLTVNFHHEDSTGPTNCPRGSPRMA